MSIVCAKNQVIGNVPFDVYFRSNASADSEDHSFVNPNARESVGVGDVHPIVEDMSKDGGGERSRVEKSYEDMSIDDDMPLRFLSRKKKMKIEVVAASSL